jgi:lipid-binding SYLF domain-containing protein
MMMHSRPGIASVIAMVYAAMCLGACVSPSGATPEERRMDVLRVRDETMRELYIREPDARREVARAAGYAVFTSLGTQFIVLSSGHGFGVAVDNTTHKRTYMRTAGLGAGLGIGVRDYRVVMVFGDRATLVEFIDRGWDFGAQGDASARIGETGGSASAEASSASGIKVYQFTENGVMVGASIRGARFWPDDELNSR